MTCPLSLTLELATSKTGHSHITIILGFGNFSNIPKGIMIHTNHGVWVTFFVPFFWCSHMLILHMQTIILCKALLLWSSCSFVLFFLLTIILCKALLLWSSCSFVLFFFTNVPLWSSCPLKLLLICYVLFLPFSYKLLLFIYIHFAWNLTLLSMIL